MAGLFTLHVVSPEGNVLKEDAEFIVLPAELGELGILPNHAPLISAMDIGVIRYTVQGAVKRMATSGGFVEVADNKVTVLAETAEPGEMIDLKRAQEAKERAEMRIGTRSRETDLKRAETALRRAAARIRAASDK